MQPIRTAIAFPIVLLGTIVAWIGIVICKLGYWIGGTAPKFDPLALYEGEEYPLTSSSRK